MRNDLTKRKSLEATHILGELAASRLFSLIHERFAELQASEGLTQADLAHKLGISEQAVSRWMVEPRDMRVRSAGRLLAALNAHLLFSIDKFEDIQAGNFNKSINVYSDEPIISVQLSTEKISSVKELSVESQELISASQSTFSYA